MLLTPAPLCVANTASSTPTSTLTWIAWFCSLPGHEYFCEVSEDFIEDDFNLTGLNSLVPFWKEAMETVLDMDPGKMLIPIYEQCVYLSDTWSVHNIR